MAELFIAADAVGILQKLKFAMDEGAHCAQLH